MCKLVFIMFGLCLSAVCFADPIASTTGPSEKEEKPTETSSEPSLLSKLLSAVADKDVESESFGPFKLKKNLKISKSFLYPIYAKPPPDFVPQIFPKSKPDQSAQETKTDSITVPLIEVNGDSQDNMPSEREFLMFSLSDLSDAHEGEKLSESPNFDTLDETHKYVPNNRKGGSFLIYDEHDHDESEEDEMEEDRELTEDEKRLFESLDYSDGKAYERNSVDNYYSSKKHKNSEKPWLLL